MQPRVAPPHVGIVLGSGLADIAGFIEQSVAIPYDDLPGFPVTTVEGHTGKLVIGDWAGTRVACMQGRFHVYEGHDPVDLAQPAPWDQPEDHTAPTVPRAYLPPLVSGT
ncbi:MAG TPA: hypothetical protein EYN24_08700, partial [Gammaproteobacteria bacterium]|nr:hypothetical protein [Gammaproteobacteria bacterium]